jgi:cytochrome c-type biogenesis protein
MSSVKSSLIVAVTLILVVVLIVVAITVMSPQTSIAPDFSIKSVDVPPINITLSQYRNNHVVLLDFMYIACPGCAIVANNLKEILPSVVGDFQVISIDVLVTDTESALRTYRVNEGIPWLVAKDTDSLNTKYSVGQELPKVFIVDKNGGITWIYSPSGGINPTAQKEEMHKQISAALSGTGGSATVAQVSVYSLAILAAVGSFFSPCSFPLLPGYMAYYLGLDAGSKQKPSTRSAAGRGFLAALGMIVVYGIIAVIVFAIGYSAAAFVGSLGLYVGVILIILGALTLTPLQYHKLIEPFRKLRQRIFPSKEGREMGVGPKMFAYGVGYGAAGFACVAPPFIAAILNASIYGNIMFGVLVLVIYSAIVIALMIAITVLLSEAGQAAVRKMNRYVNVIKKISGIALIIAGAYLIWFWFVSQS